MKIIAGLGNPGPRYRNTRHNLGFEVIDCLAQRLKVALDKAKHEGVFGRAAFEGEKLLLLKPQTFMNLSGGCVAKTARNTIFTPADLLVVVDDVNLPLGKLRFREGGSAGGHNGLKSIIERLGTEDFHRLRLGVDGGEDAALTQHVLGRFRPEERKPVREMIEKATEAVLTWAAQGPTRTMNEFN